MTPWQFCPRCAAPLVPRLEGQEERLGCTECTFVWYDNPVPVVAAIVELEGDIVLVQNRGWPGSWFGLVSGFLEKGEAPAEGVLREVKEELGLDAEIGSFVGMYPFAQMNQLLLVWHVIARGEVTISEELAGVKRVPRDKLRPWPMGTGQAVADWIGRRTT